MVSLSNIYQFFVIIRITCDTVMYRVDSRSCYRFFFYTSHSTSSEKVMFFRLYRVMYCSLVNHVRVSYLQCFLSVVDDGQQGKQKDRSQFDSHIRE